MKKNYKTIFIVSVVGILVMLSGCSNLFNMLLEPIKEKQANKTQLTVKMQFGNASGSSRVIAPILSNLVYTVSLYENADDSLVGEKADLTTSEAVTFNEVNTDTIYTIRVRGKDAEGDILLSGEKTFTAAAGVNVVKVPLVYTQSASGTGTGSMYVQYELTDDVGASVTASMAPFSGGNNISIEAGELTYDPSTKILTLNKSGIPAGTYILTLVYKLDRGDYYLNIDPLVEIFSGFTSTLPAVPLLDIADAVRAGFTYYAADISNALVNDDTNSGFRPNVPVTLNKAVELINARSDITDATPAKIVVIEDITVTPPESSVRPYILAKSVTLVSIGASPRSITLGANCENLFTVGVDNASAVDFGFPESKIVAEFKNIIIEGRLSTDVNNMVDPNGGYQNLTTFDIPMFNAGKGLMNILNGTVKLGEGAVVQNNSLIGDPEGGRGAGVFVGGGSTLELNGGTIRNCTAIMGAGVYVDDGGSLIPGSGLITENMTDFSGFPPDSVPEGYSSINEYLPEYINKYSYYSSGIFFRSLPRSQIDFSTQQGQEWLNSMRTICVNNAEKDFACGAFISEMETEADLEDAIRKSNAGIALIANFKAGEFTIEVTKPYTLSGTLFLLKEGGTEAYTTLKKTFSTGPIFTIQGDYYTQIQALIFEGNSPESDSSPLMAVEGAEVSITGKFKNNINAAGNGGGLNIIGSKAKVTLSTVDFENLTAHKGGAVYQSGGMCSTLIVQITNCTAGVSGEEGGLGGALFLEDGTFLFEKPTYFHSDPTTITACKANRQESNGGFGGAIYVGGSGTALLKLEEVTIGSNETDKQNTAYKGAGVYVGNNGFLDIIGASSLFVANGNTAYNDENNPSLRFGDSFYVEDYSLDHILLNGNSPAEYGTDGKTFIDIGISNMDINEYLFKGKGTGTEPYEISTTNDIRAMAKVPVDVLTGTWFEQKNDITFEQYSDRFSGIPYFSGTYIGNGHEITNILLDYTYCEDENFGLFSTLNSATVEGLLLRNISMSYYDDTHRYVGVLAGEAVNSTLEMCGVIGKITDYHNDSGTPYENGACGGLIGYAETSSINKSFAAVELVVKNTRDTGGLVGYMNGGSITDCYTAEYVTGGTHVGSMIGYTGANGVSIITSYAASEPGVDQGVIAAVGFIGTAENAAAVSQENTYYYNRANTQTTENSITALTALDDSNIKNQDSYSDFDFTDVWAIAENDSAPFLIWQALFYKPLYINPNI